MYNTECSKYPILNKIVKFEDNYDFIEEKNERYILRVESN